MTHGVLIRDTEYTVSSKSVMKQQKINWENLVQKPDPEVKPGQRFGRLVTIECYGRNPKDFQFIWECQCDCGNKCFVKRNNLLRGSTKSCGCLWSETQASKANELRHAQDFERFEGTKIHALKTRVPSDNTSGVKGVSWNKKREQWQAYINLAGKRHHLGWFADKKDAIEARKQAEEELFQPVIKRFENEQN